MADVEKIIINEQSYPVKDVNAVSVLEQSLTAEQKAQVQANIGVTAATNVYTKSETDTLLNGRISTTAKGTSNGVAELDGNGKVPSSQLPSFVDDVIEGYYKASEERFYEESTFTTLIEPVAGKSWVDIPTNKSYRWTGSVYTRVDEGVQIGETSDTAYAGNKGKANADAIAAINEVIPSTATSQNPLATAADIPTDAVKYTAQTLTDAQKTQARTNIGAGTSNFNGDYNALRNAPPIAKSNGTYAAAGGYYSTASGQYGFAFGYRVVTTHAGEVAFGKHNESSEDTAFAIGDGRDIQYRHNLMELKTDGTLLLNGNAVKTEGGDDNKLRLGQICGMKFSTDTTGYHTFEEGFGYLFDSINSITFTSSTGPNVVGSATVYQFGDFVGYIDSGAVIVRPVRGKINYPTTGKWIKVESGYNMFSGCTSLTRLDLSSFDTSEVEYMRGMFSRCYNGNFKSLDLSSFDTSKVKNMTYMFSYCTNLTTLDISSFDMTNVIECTDMFTNDTALTTLKTPKINPHDDIPLPRTLYSQDGTAYTNLPVTTGTSIELRASWT